MVCHFLMMFILLCIILAPHSPIFPEELALFLFQFVMELASEVIWAWAFFVGRVLITNSIYLLVKSLQILYFFLSQFSLFML